MKIQYKPRRKWCQAKDRWAFLPSSQSVGSTWILMMTGRQIRVTWSSMRMLIIRDGWYRSDRRLYLSWRKAKKTGTPGSQQTADLPFLLGDKLIEGKPAVVIVDGRNGDHDGTRVEHRWRLKVDRFAVVPKREEKANSRGRQISIRKTYLNLPVVWPTQRGQMDHDDIYDDHRLDGVLRRVDVPGTRNLRGQTRGETEREGDLQREHNTHKRTADDHAAVQCGAHYGCAEDESWT